MAGRVGTGIGKTKTRKPRKMSRDQARALILARGGEAAIEATAHLQPLLEKTAFNNVLKRKKKPTRADLENEQAFLLQHDSRFRDLDMLNSARFGRVMKGLEGRKRP